MEGHNFPGCFAFPLRPAGRGTRVSRLLGWIRGLPRSGLPGTGEQPERGPKNLRCHCMAGGLMPVYARARNRAPEGRAPTPARVGTD